LLLLNGNNGYANARILPLVLSLDGAKAGLQIIRSAISLAVWGPATLDMRWHYFIMYNYIKETHGGSLPYKNFAALETLFSYGQLYTPIIDESTCSLKLLFQERYLAALHCERHIG